MRILRHNLGGLAVILTCLTVAGGCSGMRKFDVIVDAQALSNQTVEIDLVGVNGYELERWNTINMSEYWMRGNIEREGALKHVIKFGIAEDGSMLPPEQVLSRKDDIWNQWRRRNVTHLFVMAHLPGLHEDRPGNADSRRVSIPLSSECWGWSDTKLNIIVNASNVTCITQSKCPIQ